MDIKLAIGSDHAGFALKEAVRHYLDAKNMAYKDYGAYSEQSVDYPEIGLAVSNAVKKGEATHGLLICGSGIGMSIVANKVTGVRAALCYEPELVVMSRQHNNANILVLAGRYTSPEKANKMVELFISTTFEGGRHQRRVDQIHTLTHR